MSLSFILFGCCIQSFTAGFKPSSVYIDVTLVNLVVFLIILMVNTGLLLRLTMLYNSNTKSRF